MTNTPRQLAAAQRRADLIEAAHAIAIMGKCLRVAINGAEYIEAEGIASVMRTALLSLHFDMHPLAMAQASLPGQGDD